MNRYEAIREIYKKIDHAKERVSEIKKEMDSKCQLNNLEKFLLKIELKTLYKNQIEYLRQIENIVMQEG